MGFLTRQPTTNEALPKRSPWGPTSDIDDDVAVLLSMRGKRCVGCKRVTMNRHLQDARCPDCHD